MELRQLEVFVAVATELHFGRAAERLVMAQPTVSDLVRRLERELGTPLFTRTTRRVALTEAGSELLRHSKTILDEVAAAGAVVRRIAEGDAGTVRVGSTPPAGPVLVPHLRASFAERAPGIELAESQLWLPNLLDAVATGAVDVAITCAVLPDHDGVANELLCSEPLLVGLRPGHRLTGRSSVSLDDLADDVLGTTVQTLFPAWALAQEQALHASGISPPRIPLAATDVAAVRWTEQRGVDWIMLIGSLTAGHDDTVIRPVVPTVAVPFTLQWNPSRARTSGVARFVRHALALPPPPGWIPARS